MGNRRKGNIFLPILELPLLQMHHKGKIVNDPIYGFIQLHHPLVMQVISHPWYQRLRRIHQMALAQLVYPGAVHTRLHHSLGAFHLMGIALKELQKKGIPITAEEELAAQIAILLHDIGHGPYSHGLEGVLLPGYSHEMLSLKMMETMNLEMKGQLSMAIEIFKGSYPKKFLHQLVSSQLDVDRMDYLTRDSFYTGVSEGVVGYDRILSMVTVHEGKLMVEEKAIYSIEKFLVARRLMYWQVYLHKTVLVAEQMMIRIIERAREVEAPAYGALSGFLQNESLQDDEKRVLQRFAMLDDVDILMAIKLWRQHNDPVLQMLCNGLLDRKLLKISLESQPIAPSYIIQKDKELEESTGWPASWRKYMVFTGAAQNTTYKTDDERIEILFKNGTVKDISQVDNALILGSLAATVGKYYICWPPKGS